MRAVDVLQLFAPFAWIVAVVMIRAERKLVESFRVAGATASERAVGLPVLRGPRAWQARRLVTAGVLRSTDAQTYWLDESAYRDWRRRKRRRALGVVAVLGVSAAIVWLLVG